MLNEVLTLLEEREYFAAMSAESVQEFLGAIMMIGRDYDCNQGEILEEIAERL